MNVQEQNPPATDDGHDGNPDYTNEQYVNALSPRAEPEYSELNSRKLITELAALLEKSTKTLAALQKIHAGPSLSEMVSKAMRELSEFVLKDEVRYSLLSDPNHPGDVYATVYIIAGLTLLLCSSDLHGKSFLLQSGGYHIPVDTWSAQYPRANKEPYTLYGKVNSDTFREVADAIKEWKVDTLVQVVAQATSDLKTWLLADKPVKYGRIILENGVNRICAVLYLQRDEVLHLYPGDNSDITFMLARREVALIAKTNPAQLGPEKYDPNCRFQAVMDHYQSSRHAEV